MNQSKQAEKQKLDSQLDSERQFRLFSLAILGLAALICLRERAGLTTVGMTLSAGPSRTIVVKENASESSVKPAGVAKTASQPSPQYEIDSAAEVEKINAGSYQPFMAGASSYDN